MHTSPSLWTDDGVFEYNVHHGHRIDGSKIKFWARKAEATVWAKRLGLPLSSVWKVHTRFSCGWTLKGGNGQGFLAKDQWIAHYA